MPGGARRGRWWRREGCASIGCSGTTSGERREGTTVTVTHDLTAQPPDASLALRDFAAHFGPFLERRQDSIARSLAGNQPPSVHSCTVPGWSSSNAQLPSRSPERAGSLARLGTHPSRIGPADEAGASARRKSWSTNHLR